MRHFIILLRHELRGVLLSPSTYLASFFFLLVMGFLYQWVLEDYNRAPHEMLPSNLFLNMFFFPALFIVPLFTMRSIAEERRLGLMDSLDTQQRMGTPKKPLSLKIFIQEALVH